jgi:uncharacterized protein YndB with AHSA1/START domain
LLLDFDQGIIKSNEPLKNGENRMAEDKRFDFEIEIHAPIDLVYRAFTSATALREWLCDFSTTNPVQNGRIYLAWDRGYFASGRFLELEYPRWVSFSWIGKSEPDWTEVDVTLKPVEEEITHVKLEHRGVGDGEEWETARMEIEKGWVNGLKNLKSILEDGKDLRVTERPLIGIYPEDYVSLTDQRKAELNVPVDNGVLVADLLPDYGAAQACIEAGDVIVGINGQKVDDIKTLAVIMSELKAGDEIEVSAYRGQKKMSFVIHTKVQQFKTLPDTPEELAKEIEEQSSKSLETLEQVLTGVSDAEAAYTPGEDEWSIKDVLVHLIHIERESHTWINDIVSGQERVYDEWPGDNLFRIRATLAAYPSLDDLVAELHRSLKETVASVAFIDPGFTRRKASYWRLGTELLGGNKHIEEHIIQIENNIHAARSANTK